MEACKEYLKKHQILPSISFKDGKSHTVQLVQSKIRTIKGNEGEEVEGVVFKVIEAGIPKRFFTASYDLISKLSGVPEKSVVTIQMKKRGSNGQVKSYYLVTGKEVSASETGEDDIPIVEEEDYGEEPDF